MKSLLFRSSLFLLTIAFLGMSSCDDNKDDDSPSGDEKAKQTIETNIQKGTWKVARFIDSGNDETSDFDGYSFTFAPGGTLTASNGTNTYNGNWSITLSSNNDNSPYNLDFNIIFNLANDFDDLDDDWDINSHSATKIELVDVSGGNGDTDYLTFEKN